MNPYDEIAYPSQVHPQSHPDRLTVAALLLGLEPAPAEHCRVLDLGCGDGLNLLAMALGAPGAEFVGVDLARSCISAAETAARELEAPNVTFMQGDISALPEDLGTFDYVIAHGVYSWVPEPVRDALLSSCRRLLRSNGVAYVSYSVFPGAHIKQMFREMMLYHVRDISGAETRTNAARELLAFVGGAQTGSKTWDRVLREHAEEVLAEHPGQLRHDDLAEVNEPVWWHEFARHASAHGLKYLAEADWREGSEAGLPEDIRRVLDGRASDRIEREQYLDFLKLRRFRQTLLVRDDCAVAARPLDEPISRFFIASPAHSVSLEGANGARPLETFEGPVGGALATDSPLVRAALHVLIDIWPRRLTFESLCSRSLELVSSGALGPPRDGEDPAFLRRFLLPFLALDIVRFHALSPDLADTVAERPLVHPLVRWQARRSQVVMTPLGNVVGLENGPVRTLVQLLDGTRDRAALLAALASTGAPADAAGLERVLDGLCQHGMLV